MSASIAEIAAQLQGYDPQALPADAVGAFLERLVSPVAQTGILARGEVTLRVNGETRQHGDLSDMIWDVAHMIEFLSRLYRLEPGDLIFTGTPSGVGPVVAGDRLEGRIANLAPLSIEIVPARN